MGGREVMALEGKFTGWYTLPYSGTTYIVNNPGPQPYTETHTSILAYVAQALESIELGKQVRITVEEL